MDPAVGDPHADVGADRGAVDGRDHVPVGVLEHGVAPLERGERRQRPGPGALVVDVVGGAVEGVPDCAATAVAEAVELFDPGVDQ